MTLIGLALLLAPVNLIVPHLCTKTINILSPFFSPIAGVDFLLMIRVLFSSGGSKRQKDCRPKLSTPPTEVWPTKLVG